MVRLFPRNVPAAGIALLLVFTLVAFAGPPPAHTAVIAGRLARIDEVVGRAIARDQLPGAVVLVLHRGEVVYRKAFGQRGKQPVAVPMTVDTVFDLASLTKPLVTAASVFVLVEQGKLSLTDRVAHHLAEFAKNGKDRITLEQLLLHTSGLPAGSPVADFTGGRDRALERIGSLKPKATPGERFRYSDLGYIVLGELVARVSGLPLDQFAHKHLFAPLGMTDTVFRPGAALKKRTAPTTKRGKEWIVGEVHDPRAYALGGVAGHAGLFSTADDLAVFARMLLAQGAYKGRRVLGAAAVRTFTTARPVPGGQRSPGWDVDTAYSANRGSLFPRGSGFGHTGFTGPSIWIDPTSATAVIFLCNRVHPDGKGDVRRLRGRIATIVAAAVQ